MHRCRANKLSVANCDFRPFQKFRLCCCYRWLGWFGLISLSENTKNSAWLSASFDHLTVVANVIGNPLDDYIGLGPVR